MRLAIDLVIAVLVILLLVYIVGMLPLPGNIVLILQILVALLVLGGLAHRARLLPP
jgi:hypothetical protein